MLMLLSDLKYLLNCSKMRSCDMQSSISKQFWQILYNIYDATKELLTSPKAHNNLTKSQSKNDRSLSQRSRGESVKRGGGQTNELCATSHGG